MSSTKKAPVALPGTSPEATLIDQVVDTLTAGHNGDLRIMPADCKDALDCIRRLERERDACEQRARTVPVDLSAIRDSVDVATAASLLGIKPASVRRFIRSGRISPAAITKVGVKQFISAGEFNAFKTDYLEEK